MRLPSFLSACTDLSLREVEDGKSGGDRYRAGSQVAVPDQRIPDEMPVQGERVLDAQQESEHREGYVIRRLRRPDFIQLGKHEAGVEDPDHPDKRWPPFRHHVGYSCLCV